MRKGNKFNQGKEKVKLNYYYKVRNNYGQVIDGNIERDSLLNRKNILKNHGKLIDIKEKKSLFGKSKFSSDYNLNVNQRIEFFEEFLISTEIGIPTLSILENIKNNETLNIKVRNLRSYVYQDVDKGVLLSESLINRKIPKFICGMVRTGEKLGKLEKRFETILVVDKLKEDINSTIKSIFMVPMIMLLLSTGAYYGIGKKLMPMFEKNFLSIKPDFNQLPQNVQDIFTIYHNIEWYLLGLYIFLFLSVGIFSFSYKKILPFKMYVSKKVLKIPLINKFILLKDLTIISKMLSLSLDSGCDRKTRAKNSYEQISNNHLKSKMSQVIHGTSNGLTLQERMTFVQIDGTLVTVLKQGEKRGNEKLIPLLDKVSEGYVKKIYINIVKLKDIKSLLQTLLIMIMFLPLIYSILIPQTELLLFAMSSRRG